jgi:hypothetical protein
MWTDVVVQMRRVRLGNLRVLALSKRQKVALEYVCEYSQHTDNQLRTYTVASDSGNTRGV